jgi:hypothetical protein
LLWGTQRTSDQGLTPGVLTGLGNWAESFLEQLREQQCSIKEQLGGQDQLVGSWVVQRQLQAAPLVPGLDVLCLAQNLPHKET